MDTATVVALFGLFGTVVTGVVAVVVAVINGKKERVNVAETTLEKTLRERILLRDEQIEDLKEELQETMNQRDAARDEVDRLRLATEVERAEERTRIDGP